MYNLKQAAFPAQEKRLDALVLCTTEVFMYLDDVLKLTPKTMFDKEVAYDEVEEMHHQVCLVLSTHSFSSSDVFVVFLLLMFLLAELVCIYI